VPVPWQTTIINPAYRSVVNSWNIDLTVAARSVVAGSVTAEWANITANGTQSVTVGFVIQAAPGASSICRSLTALRVAPEKSKLKDSHLLCCAHWRLRSLMPATLHLRKAALRCCHA